MNERVKITKTGHVAEVAMIRADKFNAVDAAMFTALSEAGEALKGDPDIRAVVLHGKGEHFCAGIDISSFQGPMSDVTAIRKRILHLGDGEIANEFQKPTFVWKELDVPVIAALHGVAYGAGCQIALAADIRIAAPGTRLSVMEIKWGLIPDMGIMTTLPRLVRMDVAKDLVLSGRVIGADEALSIGLVTRIAADPLVEARTLAAEIAERSPDAIRGDKMLLERVWNASPAEALRLEAELQAEVIGGTNQMEAVFANLQKRKPAFK